jgi:hypothetical protein
MVATGRTSLGARAGRSAFERAFPPVVRPGEGRLAERVATPSHFHHGLLASRMAVRLARRVIVRLNLATA